MTNPYQIEPPALISFSGGRTSGYMLRQILDAYDGRLQVTGRCDALAGYEFQNVQQLTRDYEAGVFAPAFAPRRGPQR